MKKLFFIFCAIFLSLINSCRENDQVADEYRSNLDLKSELKQKEMFKELTTVNKIRVWQSKMKQIQNENISTEQKALISKINSEIAKVAEKNYDGIKLFEYAVSLSKITPDDEFIRMFSVLGDYKRNNNSYNKFINNNRGFVTQDLEDYLAKIKSNKIAFYSQIQNTGVVSKKPTCNCKWTCGLYPSLPNSPCEGSNGGCGFLWIEDCTGHI